MTTLEEVRDRISQRSEKSRAAYLEEVKGRRRAKFGGSGLSPSNQAHAFAACPAREKKEAMNATWPNIGIITAYNDVLSAHQPYEIYPNHIKSEARKNGCTCQVAAGVPAMCDGVTQGMPGMELSLFSRDVIAMATSIGLSHDIFDSAIFLGICDKIVPGMLIGASQFGHIPSIFVPSGPMTSGIANNKKSEIRRLYADGKVSRAELVEAETASYHGPGTCTFFGTANTNQLMLEFLGLMVPSSAFVTPGTQLRTELTNEAVKIASSISRPGKNYIPISDVITENSIVNAMVGILASGGSTNHTLHLPAIARAAGIIVNWEDFNELSKIVPLLARIYPNGEADVNHFHAAGGIPFLIKTLLDGNLLLNDVNTVVGKGIERYAEEAYLDGDKLKFRAPLKSSMDKNVLRDVKTPFQEHGGLRLITSNIGRGVLKTSAVSSEQLIIKAKAVVFQSQEEVIDAFQKNALDDDCVIVMPFQGPSANGMPELHGLTPIFKALRHKGIKVAFLTDGRMSGASGEVPAVIHITPEAQKGGGIGHIKTGDIVDLDGFAGTLTVNIDPDSATDVVDSISKNERLGIGRDLFRNARNSAGDAESGASFILD